MGCMGQVWGRGEVLIVCWVGRREGKKPLITVDGRIILNVPSRSRTRAWNGFFWLGRLTGGGLL